MFGELAFGRFRRMRESCARCGKENVFVNAVVAVIGAKRAVGGVMGSER
jgi:hypothetical protein